MKYTNLSEKRKNLINDSAKLSVDENDNIKYYGTNVVVPDEMLYSFFEFSNV